MQFVVISCHCGEASKKIIIAFFFCRGGGGRADQKYMNRIVFDSDESCSVSHGSEIWLGFVGMCIPL